MYATIDQKRLSGKAVWRVHSRMASASMRNITKPRNASIEVIRVHVAAGAAGTWATADAGSVTVSCMMRGILLLNSVAGGENGAAG